MNRDSYVYTVQPQGQASKAGHTPEGRELQLQMGDVTQGPHQGVGLSPSPHLQSPRGLLQEQGWGWSSGMAGSRWGDCKIKPVNPKGNQF